MTFWDVLPQIADMGGLTLGLVMVGLAMFGFFRLALPAAKLMTDTMKTTRENYQELLDKTEEIYQRDIEEERKERRKLEERLTNTENEIGKLREQLRAKEKQIADLNELLVARQETDKGKDKTIEEMRQALRKLETKYADLKNKYDALQGQYDKLSDERDEWKSKWEVLSDGVQAIQKRDTDKLKPPDCDDAEEGKKIA